MSLKSKIWPSKQHGKSLSCHNWSDDNLINLITKSMEVTRPNRYLTFAMNAKLVINCTPNCVGDVCSNFRKYSCQLLKLRSPAGCLLSNGIISELFRPVLHLFLLIFTFNKSETSNIHWVLYLSKVLILMFSSTVKNDIQNYKTVDKIWTIWL